MSKYKPTVKDAVRKGSKQELNLILRGFKHTNGAPNFPALFDIPSAERLPVMAKNNFSDTSDLVAAGLTLAIESMNLKRGLTGPQINDLAEEIIDTANDDNLSFEDLILFLQALTRGRYGEFYESMDIPKFMTMFEKYREERWQEGIRIRDEQHLINKNLGDPERSTGKLTAMDEHLQSFSTKLRAKNDEIKALRAERNRQ